MDRSGLALKLSVIIPAYNEEQTLPAIITKVTDILLDRELIIVDDGSTESTPRILRESLVTTKTNMASRL